MANNQQKQRLQSGLKLPLGLNVSEAVQRGEFVLSVSAMLGCDYVFISHKIPHTLFAYGRLATTIREVLDKIETTPQQSMIISVFEKDGGQPIFTRLEYKWVSRQATNVVATRVTHPEQIEFMRMMVDCSTAR